MHRPMQTADPTAIMPRKPPVVQRNVKPHDKGPPPDPSLISKFKKCEPAKLKFDESEIGPNPTDVELIACGNTLPQFVQILEEFIIEGNRVDLKAGDIVMLHMVVEKEVVHAVDGKGLHFYLPIQAEQVYERLTLDPRVDDRLYIGVDGLLKADILPPMVRVIENYYSADPTECVDEEDVLELYRVDVAPDDKQHRGRLCVYGKNQQGYLLYLHQGMTTAHFTTKVSAHLHPMTELIELSFPQRVRIPSVDPSRPNIKAERIITLLGIEKEFHVITTRPGNTDEVLRIPSKIPIKMQLVNGNFRNVTKSLPALYTLVNPTWHIDEVGRPTLPSSFRQLPQPMHEVLTPWLGTFEGKNLVKEAAGVVETEVKRQITDLKNEVDMWKNLYNTVKTSIPDRPERSGLPPPPRPPKPKKSTPSPADNAPASPKLTNNKDYVESVPKPTPKSLLNKVKAISKKGKGSKTPKPPPTPTSPDPLDTNYEQPLNRNARNDYVPSSSDDDADEYDYIDDLSLKKSPKEDWKKKTESQEQMIEALRKQETSLKKELREAKTKNDEHVHRIFTLQQEIESLLNKDEDIYDMISEGRALPATPNVMQHIYNSPSSGTSPGMKISTEQLQSYTVAGVEKFLKEINLGKYAMTFRTEGIDGPLLLALDESMLMELSMTSLDARKLFVRIGKVTTGQ